MTKSFFTKETDLCRAFIEAVPVEWIAYPETGGFDILLVRKEDGFQIGVEAKLKLNAKVISQAAEDAGHWYATRPGPDCRAVLIPDSVGSELAGLCRFIGLEVIRMRPAEEQSVYKRYRLSSFYPSLPTSRNYSGRDWYEFAPSQRIAVPEFVPDVIAGSSSPIQLTPWKVKAIKIAVTLEKRGFVTRDDFKHFQISMSRWTVPGAGWLIKNGSGGWIQGPKYPDFRLQHPINYGQIEEKFEVWKRKEQA